MSSDSKRRLLPSLQERNYLRAQERRRDCAAGLEMTNTRGPRCACYPARPVRVRTLRLWPVRAWTWTCQHCGFDL